MARTVSMLLHPMIIKFQFKFVHFFPLPVSGNVFPFCFKLRMEFMIAFWESTLNNRAISLNIIVFIRSSFYYLDSVFIEEAV